MFYQGSKKLVFLRKKKKKTKDKKGSEKLFLSVHNEPVVPLSGSLSAKLKVFIIQGFVFLCSHLLDCCEAQGKGCLLGR